MWLWFKRIYSLAVADLTEFFRIELIIVSVALTPVIMMLSFGLGMKGSNVLVEGIPYFVFVVPGIFALGTMFSCTFSAGYTIISDRQRRLISDIVLSPVSYSSFVIARVISVILKSSTQLILTGLIAVLLLRVSLSNVFVFFVAFVLTAIFFGGIGMIFGSFTNALTFQGLANIILMPSMFFCGVFFPISNFKHMASIIQLLPLTAAIEVFRFGVSGEVLVGTLSSNLVLLLIYDLLALLAGIGAFKKAVAQN